MSQLSTLFQGWNAIAPMTTLIPSHAVYCGSFDPLTLGHLDIIRRGARLFRNLTVGIGINPDKRPLFEPQRRVEMTELAVADLSNVSVRSFQGLAVDFASSVGAGILLRGVRSLSDTETEFTMSLANSVLDPNLESVFLMAREKYSHISSTLIKQIAFMSADGAADKLISFVPEVLIEPLMEQVRMKRG